jgi:DNA-binding protein H-NS
VENVPVKSLVELQNQIERLQKQAAAVRTREFKKTVTEIVAAMKAFGITFGDLKKAGEARKAGRPPKDGARRKAGRPRKTRKVAKGVSRPVQIKYRGPEGETWTGRGKLPRWLKALSDAGQAIDQYKVN